MNDATLLTLHELAKRLRVPKTWLRREVVAGRVPFLRAGRRRLFNADAVTTVLAERAAQGEVGKAAMVQRHKDELSEPEAQRT